MLPGDLPDSVTRRALDADGTSVIWHLADAPDVIAACEARGALLRLASVVHVHSGSVRGSEDDVGWGWRETAGLFPPAWPGRVACAAASAREVVEQARPLSEALDPETDSALFVAQPVSRHEAGRIGFPRVLLAVLVGAPLLWASAAAAAAALFDWRSRVSADGLLWGLAVMAAIGLTGGLLSLAAGGLARVQMRRAAARTLGAPLRPGEAAALPRTFARVGVLAAVLYIWGPMMAFAFGRHLVPGASGHLSVTILVAVLACTVIAHVAYSRNASQR